MACGGQPCEHLEDVGASRKSIGAEECADCGWSGPNLWMCMHRACLKIGCPENAEDHSTRHSEEVPEHCVFINLTTNRIWCNECRREVFIKLKEVDECLDSGRGSYNTLRNTSEMNGVGGGVWMAPDASDSSDADEPHGDEDDFLDGRPIGLVGLQNIGNTCYMNAALQALSNTLPLTNFFLECPASVQLISEDRKPGLSRQYQALMRDMWMKRNSGYVTPSGILYGIRNVHAMFRGFHQHDTQEFLRNFMDQLHEELKQICPPECMMNDIDTITSTTTTSNGLDEQTLSSSYESSEGEYETCDSGVSERSSLSDDTERTATASKRRMSRSSSPRRLRQRIHSCPVIDSQPSTSTSSSSKKQQLRYRSIISDIFDGKLLSSVQCLTCDRVSSRVETFQDLSLPIPSRDHLVVLHGRSVTSNGAIPGGGGASSISAPPPASLVSGVSVTCSDSVLPIQEGWISWIIAWLRSWFYGPTVTLHDCLAAFFSTDELKGDNMYSCERCNKLRNGLKYSKVLQLPEVLSIHLKRFRHELMYSSKISSAVSFPLKGLEMKPYLHKDCISQVTNYELFSVICHHGTAGGGHYTCYALNNNQWYEFDDQCVTKVPAEAVQNCEAYVLFYRKVVENDAFKAKIAQMNGDDSEPVYVSKQWLSRFNTCAEPGPIDNSDFLCVHGGINPRRSMALEQLSISIPKAVYDVLHKRYGGSPATNAHICAICQATHRRIAFEFETLQRLNGEFESQQEPPTHLLSSSWYNQWKTFIDKSLLESPGPVDNTKLSLAEGGGEEYIEINEDIWNFFYGIYGGGPELTIRSREFPEDRKEIDYCKGDPIETDEILQTPTVQDDEETTLTVPKQPNQSPGQGQGQTNLNHSSNSNTSLTTTTTDDEKVREERTEGKANRHRRRRRRDFN